MRIPLIAVAVLWAATTLDAQIIKEGGPHRPKVNLPPLEEVQREIAEARSVKSASMPAATLLSEVVATVDGEPITLDEVLDEVMVKHGAQYSQALVQQAMFGLILLKRDVEVTEDEVVDAIRHRIAQARLQSSDTLKQRLEESRTGWDRFEKAMRQTAQISKMVKADQNVRDPGPPNPFVMQVWAQRVRGEYEVETAVEKLPAGCFGRVKTTMPVSRVLALLARRGEYRATPVEGGVLVQPVGEDWPQCTVPAVEVPTSTGAKVAVTDLVSRIAAGGANARTVVAVSTDGAALPSMLLPVGTAKKIEAEKKSDVPLTEAVAAVLAGTHDVDVATGEARPKAEGGVLYRLPKIAIESPRPPFRMPIAAALAECAGKGGAATTMCAVDCEGGLAFVPDVGVPVTVRIDRGSVLELLFGGLKLVHFEQSLESLARFRAIKRAFRGIQPGTTDGKAPWGVITVDEKAVKARIQAERKKFAGTLFPWEMICQILGKTVPEEMRRFWVGNGVDQVIGTDVTDEELLAYYNENVELFGVATVEAWHILIQEKHPKTGRIQWDKALTKANEVLAMIRTGSDFGAMAAEHSEDEQTRMNDGDLGLFAIESRYDPDLCRAAFKLEPGEMSEEPVKTKLGYHIIKLRAKKGPDTKKYGFESDGMKERVREVRQDRRREAWLAENVEGKYRLESRLEEVLQ